MMPRGNAVLAVGYRYFLTVAAVNSVRAASRVLNIAPSAISRQILLLEAQLGLELFERHDRALKLTEAGGTLLASLKSLQDGFEDALVVLNGFKDLKRGTVRIAAVESVAVSLLPDLIMEFAKIYPGFQAAVSVSGADCALELLRNDDVDLAFTFNPATLDGLTVDFAHDFYLGAAMAPDHALRKKETLTLADCLNYPVAWPAHGLSLRAIIGKCLGTASLQTTAILECNSLHLMASLARQGGCIAFQTRIGIEQDIEAGRLILKSLTDAHLPADRLMLVRRDQSVSKAPVRAFLDVAMRRLLKSYAEAA